MVSDAYVIEENILFGYRFKKKKKKNSTACEKNERLPQFSNFLGEPSAYLPPTEMCVPTL